jgi:O-antigen/teichoic acid export membrane protein
VSIATPPDPPAPFALQPFRQLLWGLSIRSSAYSVGLATIRFGGFFLIPLYWRYLDTTDYGILAVASIVTNFLSVVLGLGISESVLRFYHEWTPERRRSRLGSLWVLDWGSSLAIGLPLAAWGGALTPLVSTQVPFDPYLRLAVLSATVLSMATTPVTLLRVEERAGTYLACAGAAFGLRAVLSLALLIGAGMGPAAVLVADVLSGTLMLPVYTLLLLRHARPALDRGALKEGLTYSAPLIPAILAESVASVADRFVLERFVSLPRLGLYAVGDSLGGAVRILNTGLKTAWLPFQIRAAVQRADGPLVIARMATFFVAALLWVALAIAATGEDLVVSVGVPRYYPVGALLPFFVLPHLVSSFIPIVSGGIAVARRTGHVAMGAILQLAVAVAALLWLVPRYGIGGAIAAMTLAAVVRLTFTFAVARHFYPVPWEWHKIGWLTGAALLAFAAARAVPWPPSIPGLLLRASIVASSAVAASWLVLGGHAAWHLIRARPPESPIAPDSPTHR